MFQKSFAERQTFLSVSYYSHPLTLEPYSSTQRECKIVSKNQNLRTLPVPVLKESERANGSTWLEIA